MSGQNYVCTGIEIMLLNVTASPAYMSLLTAALLSIFPILSPLPLSSVSLALCHFQVCRHILGFFPTLTLLTPLILLTLCSPSCSVSSCCYFRYFEHAQQRQCSEMPEIEPLFTSTCMLITFIPNRMTQSDE